MPLLAHLVPRIAGAGVEPAATQALAYLLRSDATANAFVSLLAPAGLDPFPPAAIAAEQHLPDDTRPDLAVRDPDGHLRLLVENKFWAGLTDAQPLAYLEAGPVAPPSTVLFIAPYQRLTSLWPEIKRRLTGRFSLENETATETLIWGRTGGRTLTLTSWRHVLVTLSEATADRTLRRDIAQLRELTDQMNTDVFLPLTEAELSDVAVPRRLINYADLVNDIAGRLLRDGLADKKGLQTGHTAYRSGRYLRLCGRFVQFLGVDLEAWRTWGHSPIWSRHYSGVQGRLSEARALFEDAQTANGFLWIPIHLTTGVDRARVIDDAARQVARIGERLDSAFPGKPANVPKDPETP